MLEIDLSEFERRAREIGGAVDQVPFALSVALNDAAFKTRTRIIAETWPSAIQVRNKSFMRAALRVDPSTKAKLNISIFDTLNRAHLKKHAVGGVKQARGRLAIPTAAVSRGASGVRASQKPGALKRAVVKGNLIFQAEGRGKTSKLRLMYKLTRQAKIKQDVPFYPDFDRFMLDEARAAFPKAMAKAMRTRRS